MDVPVNYGAVAIAGVAGYALGGLWYGPLFGAAWRRLAKTDEGRPTAFVIIAGIISSLVMSFVLACVYAYVQSYRYSGGILPGLVVGACSWLGFIAPVTLGSVLYERRPWSLWLLNNGYWLVSLLVMGAILAVWN